MFRLILLALVYVPLSAEIIDRIAVTVGYDVITESEIVRQIRLTAFQNGEQPDFGPESKRKAADKLVEQMLIRKEIEGNRYPGPPAGALDAALKEFKSQYPTPGAFEQALAKYGLTEDELRLQLQWQGTLIPFIDTRFKPGIQIPEADIKAYYEKHFVPQWSKDPSKTPSLEESREAIEGILTAQRADQALDRWLGQARTQTRIKFRDEVFR
jgi:hypothetical protein